MLHINSAESLVLPSLLLTNMSDVGIAEHIVLLKLFLNFINSEPETYCPWQHP